MDQAQCYKPEGRGSDSRWGGGGSLISFRAPIPSSPTMAPGFTQPVTEMSTGRFLVVKRGSYAQFSAFY
jgi:hypothetical protein